MSITNTRTAIVVARAQARSSGTTAHAIQRAAVGATALSRRSTAKVGDNLFYDTSPTFDWIRALIAGAATYHGYKRNQSIPWAIGWFALGSIFPVPTIAIAAAQGFGKKAGS